MLLHTICWAGAMILHVFMVGSFILEYPALKAFKKFLFGVGYSYLFYDSLVKLKGVSGKGHDFRDEEEKLDGGNALEREVEGTRMEVNGDG